MTKDFGADAQRLELILRRSMRCKFHFFGGFVNVSCCWRNNLIVVRVVVQAGPTAVVMRAHKGTIAYGVEVGTLATLWGTQNRR